MRNKHLIYLYILISFFHYSCKKTEETKNIITYPASGFYGKNLLDSTTFTYNSGQYSMNANVPSGQKLKVKIYGDHNWAFEMGKIGNWYSGDWDNTNNSREFYSNHNTFYEMGIYVSSSPSNSMKIEIFENGATSPTREKNIVIN